MDSVLLKVQELSYSYHTLNGETPALDRVSFCLYRKEFLAIVGPSGCGKSTILSLIAGLLTPGSGGITFYKEFPWGCRRRKNEKRNLRSVQKTGNYSGSDPTNEKNVCISEADV